MTSWVPYVPCKHCGGNAWLCRCPDRPWEEQ